MGVHVERTDLPGIGVRHDMMTSSGDRVGVVAYHDGRRDLVVFDPEDPDSCKYSIELGDDEAAALADVLGTSIMLSQLSDIRHQAQGLLTEQLTIPTGSDYAGRPLGDTRARTRTGASIVAILRGNEVIASPAPNFVIDGGDIVLAVGTRRNLDDLAEILAGSPA